MRERAARAVVDAEEASCALRLALRRQAELQGSGRSCPLHPGEDVQYLCQLCKKRKHVSCSSGTAAMAEKGASRAQLEML